MQRTKRTREEMCFEAGHCFEAYMVWLELKWHIKGLNNFPILHTGCILQCVMRNNFYAIASTVGYSFGFIVV